MGYPQSMWDSMGPSKRARIVQLFADRDFIFETREMQNLAGRTTDDTSVSMVALITSIVETEKSNLEKSISTKFAYRDHTNPKVSIANMAWASDVQKLVDSNDIDGLLTRLQHELPLMKQGTYFENRSKNKPGASAASSEFVPALPCLQCVATGVEGGEEPLAHRLRKTSVMDQFIDGMVARSVSRK